MLLSQLNIEPDVPSLPVTGAPLRLHAADGPLGHSNAHLALPPLDEVRGSPPQLVAVPAAEDLPPMLERLYAVELDVACEPDPLHRSRRHALCHGHRPARPVRLTLGLFMHDRLHDLCDLLRRDQRLRAPALANHTDPLQAVIHKPLALVGYRCRRNPQSHTDHRVGDTVGG